MTYRLTEKSYSPGKYELLSHAKCALDCSTDILKLLAFMIDG